MNSPSVVPALSHGSDGVPGSGANGSHAAAILSIAADPTPENMTEMIRRAFTVEDPRNLVESVVACAQAGTLSFEELNAAYVAKFGFPFIIAVRDNTKAMILSAMHTRVGNDRHTEFKTACGQVERIALLRLRAILPEL